MGRDAGEVLHLHTPIQGQLLGESTPHVLRLVDELHPTPAVSGAPSEDASRILAAQEPDRGWYTGPVGWFDSTGDGDFWVALRCALVGSQAARAWAGAGIVPRSRPEQEERETAIKLTTILQVLDPWLA